MFKKLIFAVCVIGMMAFAVKTKAPPNGQTAKEEKNNIEKKFISTGIASDQPVGLAMEEKTSMEIQLPCGTACSSCHFESCLPNPPLLAGKTSNFNYKNNTASTKIRPGKDLQLAINADGRVLKPG